MFCPKCGQEQALDSVRFCSGCGAKLNLEEEPLIKRLTKIVLFLVLAAFAIMGWASATSGPAYMQVRIITTFIALITFYLLFSRDLKHIFDKLFTRNIEQVKQIAADSEKRVLPSAQSIPVSVFESHRVTTAELVQPLSVTEQTTTLIGKNEP